VTRHLNAEADVPSAPDSVLHAPHRRWRIAVLLGIGVLVNFFDRVNISVAYDALRTNWGITAVTFGYLASAYNWTYAVLRFPSASCSIAGRAPHWPRRDLPLEHGLLRLGLATGIYSFFAAACCSASAKLPHSREAKAVGYWFPDASAASPPPSTTRPPNSLPPSAFHSRTARDPFGWAGVSFHGFVSFLYFLLFWGVYRNPSEDPRLSPAERSLMPKAMLSRSPRPHGMRTALRCCICCVSHRSRRHHRFAAYNYVFYLVLIWLPSYLSMSFTSSAALRTRYQHPVAVGHRHRSSHRRLDGRCSRPSRRTPVAGAPGVLVGGLAFGMESTALGSPNAAVASRG